MHSTDLFDFGPFPILATERLVLREILDSDAADVLVCWGDPEVQKYNSEPLTDLAATHTFIGEVRARYAAREEIMWAVALRERPVVLGYVDLHAWNRFHRRAEIGYSLSRAWWGQGFASEYVRAVIDFGFTRMSLHRVTAMTIADNHRSVSMLERLGFHREGTRREYSWEEDGTFHDSAIYGLLEYETEHG